MNKTRIQSLLEFIRHIASGVTTASIYPLEHTQVQHLERWRWRVFRR